MISQPERARPRRRRESYDEKCERRHEKRENLRRRKNLTSCRHLGRAAGGLEQSPRQQEFLRRRNLAIDAGQTPLGWGPKARVPLDISQVEPRLPILLQPDPSAPHSPFCRDADSAVLSFQHPGSPAFPPAPVSLSVPLSTSAEAKPRPGASMNTQGTQTLTNPSPTVTDSSQQTDCGIAVLDKEIVQLSNYLKEALHRELLLKQKMVILQELFSTLLQASEKSWQGQLNEDKLKCKLRALENQLQACTQNYTKECVKKILIEMEDQKQTYEQKAKEALQKMLEDKLQAEQELQNSQRKLAVTRQDLALWKEHHTRLTAQLTDTSTAHTELENSFHLLQSELQVHDPANPAPRSGSAGVHSSALREDNRLQARHISTIRDQLQKEQSQRVALEATIGHLQSLIQSQAEQQRLQEAPVQRKDQVFTTQTPPLTPTKEKQNILLEHPEEEGEESLEDEVQERTSQLAAKENKVRKKLNQSWDQCRACLAGLRQCRDQLNHFQSQQAKRLRSHWVPVLLAVTAVAIATFLTSYRP
ncbi:TRAF3-interacting JNK-activating modulator [Chaetura pelagica]|nr:TRAF3-interacting JNK-activating modulator [Chaetura pelagica]